MACRAGARPHLPSPPMAKRPNRTARRSAAEPPLRVAVVVSRYNESVTTPLLEGAIAVFRAHANGLAMPDIFDAPGAFELTALSAAAAKTGRYAGIVALGCVIRGETRHDRYICDAVANGLTHVTLATGIPIAFGLLTTENVEQARARAGGRHGNKGVEAMEALLATIACLSRIAEGNAEPVKAIDRPDKAGSKARAKRSGAAGGRR